MTHTERDSNRGLDEATFEIIEQRAQKAFRDYSRRKVIQTVSAKDGLDWWVAQETAAYLAALTSTAGTEGEYARARASLDSVTDGDIDRADIRAALTRPSVAGWVPSDFPYQQTFNAIAAATKIEAGRISISVTAFKEAFLASPLQLDEDRELRSLICGACGVIFKSDDEQSRRILCERCAPTSQAEPYENSLSLEELRREYRWHVDRFYGLLQALKEKPAFPKVSILNVLSSAAKYPEDYSAGKIAQREVGSEVIPFKTECEMGAGLWLRLLPALSALSKRAGEREGDNSEADPHGKNCICPTCSIAGDGAAKPFYSRQTGDPMTTKEEGEWIVNARREARDEGATDVRVSCRHGLILVEGWRDHPTNCAEPSFHYAASLKRPDKETA